MAAPILVTGDTAVFPSNCFTGLDTDEMSAPLTGTGKFKVGGKPACVAGDEASAVVAVCPYSSKAYPTKGVATLTISALVPPQQSQVATSGTKAALLAASEFIAELKVSVPASIVKAGVLEPDATPTYVGKGKFQSQNDVAKTTK